MTGLVPATPHIFHTAAGLVKSFEEGKTAERNVAQFEAEGFVEAATAHTNSQSEPKAEGVSTVIVFETSTGAKADLKRELNVDVAPSQVGKHIFVIRFKVPGVPEASAYELSGFGWKGEEAFANALFVEGSCLLIVGDYKPRGKKVTQPVIAGTRAIHRRIGGRCP